MSIVFFRRLTPLFSFRTLSEIFSAPCSTYCWKRRTITCARHFKHACTSPPRFGFCDAMNRLGSRHPASSLRTLQNRAVLNASRTRDLCLGSPPGQLRSDDYFRRVLASLAGERSLAFAYGSGVFLQAGQTWNRNNMADFIIVTDDPEAWHRENLMRNAGHYSSLLHWWCRSSGSAPRALARLQAESGARIFFNTLVPFEDGLIKYGVISTKDLITDLLSWETLYVAGRLHKPVNILEMAGKDELNGALRTNLAAALSVALLSLPARFEERDLYLGIAGISYTGDLRMLVGEDKNKVKNIVDGQLELFRNLYKNRVRAMAQHLRLEHGRGEQDTSEDARLFHLRQLPQQLQQQLIQAWNMDGEGRTPEEILQYAAKVPARSSRIISEAIAKVVKGPSTSQALKGILTAGPYKATVYSWAKLKKMFKSLLK